MTPVLAPFTRRCATLSLLAIAALSVSSCTVTPHPTDTSELNISADALAIAALDYESAAVIAELGFTDSLVLIPEATVNPALSGHAAELAAVTHTFPTAVGLGPEAIMRTEPNLVVLSTRHGADDTLGSVLEQAGFHTLQLTNSWNSPAQVAENIERIGRALGAEGEAEALQMTLQQGFETHTAASPITEATSPDSAPSVLVLTNQAGRPFITAGDAHPLHLLNLAGGRSASESMGLTTTGPISVEQIIQAAPDALLLIDMNGSGDRMFEEILTNPALAEMLATQPEPILRVTGREVQAVGLTENIAGLHQLTEWVATL